MPDRSKVMTQTKRVTLVIEVGCWALSKTKTNKYISRRDVSQERMK